ncbi:sugar ABC transporter permease [Aurantimonas sp. 22II-16-19i]|uniref:carbohydrate ABC transporter permease n=1 Tax=Aurantimonas sp. 22II-16-19i TaxID=1317114 RepID=UPI0009F7B05E|nr:sugar ABC transporter permease [Aurantimonas sp. 22II-16-19i]ORE96933.1 ABC transporter permease [Aurantimonas sp. 22II-16-19i]
MPATLAGLQRRRLTLYALMLLSPAMILMTTFAFYPAIATFFASAFSRGTSRRPSVFVGLENYADLAADPVFWQVVGNNVLYALVTVPLSVVLALAMALWANEKIPARSFVRASYFTPTMLPMIAAANLWLFFYTPGIGLLDRIGALFGASSVNWLGQPETALWSVMAVAVWKESGFFMIFYLAALQTIPPELKEAARIEGAGRWTYTRRIVLPLLMPTTLFVVVNALINSVRVIDHLFILTKGGPDNASKLILYWIWEMAFAYFDAAHAAAMTALVLLALGLLAGFQFAIIDRKAHYR